MTGRAPLLPGLGLVAAGLVILGIGAVAGTLGLAGPGDRNPGGPGSMMGDEPTTGTMAGPDSSGFVPGTAASPRVVRIVATAQLRFVPDAVTVKQSETITFEVTSMGPLTHEFMVEPAADVAADKPGTPALLAAGESRRDDVDRLSRPHDQERKRPRHRDIKVGLEVWLLSPRPQPTDRPQASASPCAIAACVGAIRIC